MCLLILIGRRLDQRKGKDVDSVAVLKLYEKGHLRVFFFYLKAYRGEVNNKKSLLYALLNYNNL